jgi:hypothetical protein
VSETVELNEERGEIKPDIEILLKKKQCQMAR